MREPTPAGSPGLAEALRDTCRGDQPEVDEGVRRRDEEFAPLRVQRVFNGPNTRLLLVPRRRGLRLGHWASAA